MIIKRFRLYWIQASIVAAAIVPAALIDDSSRNLLLIGIMALSPIIFFIDFKLEAPDFLLILFASSIIFFPFLLHPETVRWSTLIYTLMFISFFLAYKSALFRGALSVEAYLNIIRFLIFAYFFTLVLQQLSVLFNFPIPNLSHYRPNEPWKLNSLSIEPSHSARVVGILMISFILISELQRARNYRINVEWRKDKYLWLAFFWTMFTMGSSTTYIFVILIAMYFLSNRTVASFFIMTIFIYFIGAYFKIDAMDEILAIVLATISLDEQTILGTGSSGAYRILPTLVLIKMVDITTIESFFGHGVDHVSQFLYLYVPGLPIGSSGGGVFQIWIDYGLVPFALFITYCLRSLFYFGGSPRRLMLEFSVLLLIILVQGINNQLLWFALMIFLTNRYFMSRVRKKHGAVSLKAL